jgi:hypothetical protein
MIYTKLYIPVDPHLFDPPLHTKAKTSSHSHNFHPHHFQRDLRLPHVNVTKFYGSDPTSWVTQMEHYFSLDNITDLIRKFFRIYRIGFLIFDVSDQTSVVHHQENVL